MKPKLLVTIIILTLAIVAWIAHIIWFGNNTLDINLHDTYFVIAPFHLYLLYAKAMLVLLFGARCIVGRFQSTLDNLLLLIALLLTQQACISVGLALNHITVINHGRALYPPLSAMPKIVTTQSQGLLYSPTILSVLQIILTILLVIVAIITGKNWYRPTHDTIS